jgi:hypothetical protein
VEVGDLQATDVIIVAVTASGMQPHGRVDVVQTTTTVQTTTSAAVVRPVIGRATAVPPTFRIH